jgi:hypothetical protein
VPLRPGDVEAAFEAYLTDTEVGVFTPAAPALPVALDFV